MELRISFDTWISEWGNPSPRSRIIGWAYAWLVVFDFFSEIFYTEYIGVKKQTRGIETSKYPEERTSIETPLVAASERGPGLV